MARSVCGAPNWAGKEVVQRLQENAVLTLQVQRGPHPLNRYAQCLSNSHSGLGVGKEPRDALSKNCLV